VQHAHRGYAVWRVQENLQEESKQQDAAAERLLGVPQRWTTTTDAPHQAPPPYPYAPATRPA
jgi:hypothetical protein